MASFLRPLWNLRTIAALLAISMLPLVMPSRAEAAPAKRIEAKDAPALRSTTFRSTKPTKHFDKKTFTPSVRGFKAGKSRLVKSSDSGEVFRNEDGTTTTFIRPSKFDGPRLDRGETQKLLRATNGSFTAKNRDATLSLSPQAHSKNARIETPRGSVSFGLKNASPVEPLAVSDSVEYRNVAPGIDLVYTATSSGLKEVIRVNDRSAVRTAYEFDLATDGLTPSQDNHGNVNFTDKNGDIAVSMPPGLAIDSGQNAHLKSGHVAIRLGANNASLQVVPDPEWLNSPARVFPLLIDPTAQFGGNAGRLDDTTISNLNQTTNYNSLQDGSGTYVTKVGVCSGLGEAYGYMKWDLSLLAGRTVTNADLTLNVIDVANPNPANTIKMWRTEQHWEASDFTWSKMLAGQGNHGSTTMNLGAPTTGHSAYNLTSWVQNWVAGTWTNYGVSMDTTNTNTCYSLGAQENQIGGYAPTLVVTANNQTPINAQITSPDDWASSVSAWPTFSATATDPDGDPLKYRYQIATDDTFTDIVVSSPLADSSWTSETQLNNGQTYALRVIAYDDPFGDSTTSPIRHFTVNAGGGSQVSAANDTVGPVAVSMTTGNVATSVTSPVANSVGGGLGVTWTYNSHDTGSTVGMPRGWTMGPVANSETSYSRAKISNNAVTLMDSTGVPHAHIPTGTSGAPGNSAPGFKPPADDLTQVARTTYAGATAYSATEPNGTNFIFNAVGQLRQVTNPTDAQSIGSATFNYDNATSSGKLTSIVDTVGASASPSSPPSTSKISFTYTGQSGCAASPPGFDQNLPAGLLCKVTYFDGTSSDLFYVDVLGTRVLQRIVNPGGETFNFAYTVDQTTTNAFMTRAMDPLQSDWLAANPPASEEAADLARTVITYDAIPHKAKKVTLAAPTGTSLSTQPTRTYSYTSAPGGGGTTTMSMAGMVPSQGFTSKITFNEKNQVTSSIDSTGIETQNTWDDGNRLLTTTNLGTQRKSTAVYDERGFQTDAYGPAPASCFDGQLPTSGCANTVPHTNQVLDGTAAFKGLGVTYWSNTSLDSETQAAASHATGVGTGDGSVDVNWGTTLPSGVSGTNGWSTRLRGGIQLDQTGDYTFSLTANDGVRLWIDDQLVIDEWKATATAVATYTSSTFNNTVANKWHRIRIEYRNFNGSSAQLKLQFTPPGQGSQTVPGYKLRPDYGLVTQTTSHDGASGSPTSVTNIDFVRPEYGQVSSTTQDPSGLALTTSYGYDNQGGPGHWFRLTSKTLPGGNTTSYNYFGDQETPTNYCTSTTAPSQRGLSSSTAQPTGAGGAQVIKHSVYDVMGRSVCSRTNNNSSIATTYDSRGRIASTYVPGVNSIPGRYTAYNYAVGGDPLVSSISDTPDGGATTTVTTTVDLLGQVVEHTDAHNRTTSFKYSQAGHMIEQSSWGHVQKFTYNSAGQLTDQFAGWSTSPPKVASATYSSTTGELTGVTYPSGTGNAGNNTTAAFSYDAATGLPTNVSYNVNSGGLTISDTQTYSRTGRVLSAQQTEAGSSTSTNTSTYSYDAAGRLTQAVIPGKTLTYGFGSTNTSSCSGYSGVNTNAGKNSNRTSVTDSVLGTTYYCYDNADRLIATTDSRYSAMYGKDLSGNSTAYDDRGNTVSSDSNKAVTYDLVNRHVSSTDGTDSVSYKRDGTDRIIERTANGQTLRYSYSTSGDSPDSVMDTSNTILDLNISLIGGVTLNKHYEPSTSTYSDIWSYTNLHGDTLFTADGGGTKTSGVLTYDPYGQPLNGLPNNSSGDFDFGSLGGHTRGTEHMGSLNTIEMGARQYVPGLGRFLSVDPIDGGSANAYEYVNGDPVNGRDLEGTMSLHQMLYTLNRLTAPIRQLQNYISRHDYGTASAGAVNIAHGLLMMQRGITALATGTASLPLIGPIGGSAAYAFGAYKIIGGVAKINRGIKQLRTLGPPTANARSVRANTIRFAQGVLPGKSVMDKLAGLAW